MDGEAEARMRAGNRRLGRARRQVIDAIAQEPGPVTAGRIIDLLPEVHPSSIYRTLNVLEDLGYVRHVHLAHGAALYELAERVSDVRHLVCEVCGKTTQVPNELLRSLAGRLHRDYGFVLDSDHFALPGRCSTCQRDASSAHH